jgi:hypothetical protein
MGKSPRARPGRATGCVPRASALLLLCFCVLVGTARASELKEATANAFAHYVKLSEARMAREFDDPGGFLWVDRLPPQRRLEVLAQFRQGEVVTATLETLENGQPISVPDGLIHHWVATVFVQGIHLAGVIAEQQDYGRAADLYAPDIQRSKLLHADGNDFQVYFRLYRKVFVTATYNADFDIRYTPVDAKREFSWSHSTRIAEVVKAGQPDEYERPVGNDHGYVWVLNTYTRYEEKDGGVYIQVEFIALSRSVPAIFAWLVNPYVKSVPQDYLTHILSATRLDLMRRAEADARHQDGNAAAPAAPVALRARQPVPVAIPAK